MGVLHDNLLNTHLDIYSGWERCGDIQWGDVTNVPGSLAFYYFYYDL